MVRKALAPCLFVFVLILVAVALLQTRHTPAISTTLDEEAIKGYLEDRGFILVVCTPQTRQEARKDLQSSSGNDDHVKETLDSFDEFNSKTKDVRFYRVVYQLDNFQTVAAVAIVWNVSEEEREVGSYIIIDG